MIGGSIGTFDPDSVSNGGFSINGARSDEYVVIVDGAVATRTRSSGSMLGAQDIDTVQEVQILAANYNAEYGRSWGGQILVRKSGTTSFHGDRVENFRNSALTRIPGRVITRPILLYPAAHRRSRSTSSASI